MKKILLFAIFISFYCIASAQDFTIDTGDDEMNKFKQSAEAILQRMQSDSESGKQDSMLILYNAMQVFHPEAKEIEEAKKLALKAEKIAAALGIKLLSPKISLNASPTNATFPYGKMLNLTEEELEAKKFKYSEQYNRWVLTYSNGANSFISVMQALNGQVADIQPHPDDYSVTIQKGDNDIAYVSVAFYKDDTYHDILTFINDNGKDILETSSGDIVKTQFNYDKFSFTLEMKRIGKSTVTRKTAAAAKQIDNSYNYYNFTIYTGVPATSPYLTKMAEKDAKRESKGRKENDVNDLMF